MRTIAQRHHGIDFRSRTEARWAEFFWLTGTPFEYEPEGFDLGGVWYVPDFWLPHPALYVEVKGKPPSVNETDKMLRLSRAAMRPVVCVVGNPSSGRAASILWPSAARHPCWFVAEYRGDGAWLARFMDAAEWCIALASGLNNYSTEGKAHWALDIAQRLQFQRPDELMWRLLHGHHEPGDRNAR